MSTTSVERTTSDAPGLLTMVARQYDYYLTLLKRTWRGSIVSFGLLPILFMVSMGLGLGGYVDDGDNAALGGVTYLVYIAPGMLATNTMTAAVADSSWPVFGNFKWTKLYYAMTSTPLRIVDVLNGSLVFAAARLALISAVLVVVLTAFGTVSGPLGAVAAVGSGTLLGLAYAAPTHAYSAHLSSDAGFALLFRLGVIPMMLFSGAFFPVQQLPDVIEWIAYLIPVWHGVELTRMCTTGDVDVLAAAGHIGYLLMFVVVGWFLARAAFSRRLRDGAP